MLSFILLLNYEQINSFSILPTAFAQKCKTGTYEDAARTCQGKYSDLLWNESVVSYGLSPPEYEPVKLIRSWSGLTLVSTY